MALGHRTVRMCKRVLLPLLLLYALFSAFSMHMRNLYNNHVSKVQGYTGGQINDLRRIRCYAWYGNCNQIVENDGKGDTVTWFKVERAMDLDGLSSSGRNNVVRWYHDFLYVRYAQGMKSIVDIALGDSHSGDPPEYVSKDASSSIMRPKSRFDVTYNYNNWDSKQDGIWVKYDKPGSRNVVTDLTYLFGEDVIEPREQWTLVPGALDSSSGHPVRISIARDIEEDTSPEVMLKFTEEQKFRILQLSDLHFVSGTGKCRDQFENRKQCEADSKTLNFVHEVLDQEQPQLVVITGDLLDGHNTFDYQTALLKALSPFIARKIPFAVALGEHDTSAFVEREEIVHFISTLPGSIMVRKDDIHTTTNYVVPVYDTQEDTVTGAVYLLDLFTEATEGVTETLKMLNEQLKDKPAMSMVFQHFPIQDYRPKGSFAIVGSYNEKHKLKSSNSDQNTRKALSDLNIQAISVGSEHTNECCVRSDSTESLNELWMCFGGGVGEGGYGSRSMDRRVRLFEFKAQSNEITTWKRRQGAPQEMFDYQYIQRRQQGTQ